MDPVEVVAVLEVSQGPRVWEAVPAVVGIQGIVDNIWDNSWGSIGDSTASTVDLGEVELVEVVLVVV